MHRKGTSGCCQTMMYDPGAKHLAQMFLTGSRVLEREENRSTRGETLESGWDRLWLNPRTIAQERGVNVEYNVNLSPPGVTAQDTRMVAHPDINPNQLNSGNQIGTGAFPWTSRITELSKRIMFNVKIFNVPKKKRLKQESALNVVYNGYIACISWR